MSISVCMAVHNGAAFIAEQLNSILPQLSDADELIVSDDASTDSTLTIIRSYADLRIRILQAQNFGTPSKNFEYALRHCQYETIFLADQDDIWHAHKIKKMTDALATCDLVVCDCRLVNGDHNVVTSSFFEKNKTRHGLLKNLFKNSFVGCCMAFNQKVLIKALPFPTGVLAHDQWIGLIAQRDFTVKFMPEILVDHRRHSHNYSTTGGISKNSFGEKVISRVLLAKMLLQH